jgi:glucose/arabinose dehydrogenase
MKPVQRLTVTVIGAGALLLLAALMLTVQARALAAPLAPEAVTAVQYATGMDEPIDIANTGIPTDTRLFVTERDGRIRVIHSNGMTGTLQSTPFLNIDPLVDSTTNGEMGLLGLAFSPNYASDGYFYVYYNDNNGDIQLSRFSVSADPNIALTTETKILNIPHPNFGNHNGGDLAFGPDGFLYLAPGDGGGTPANGQNMDTLLGKVLRLHVTGQVTYTIPITNPFFGPTPGRDEIWALGLRNPFRFSFDRQTGDLYVADVGASTREEVNFQPASSTGGENYGWQCYEGTYLRNQPDGCADDADYVPPVADYCNSAAANCTDGGSAVIGGHVYRGAAYPGLAGYYFYADAYTNRFWALRPGTWNVTPLGINNVSSPAGFGEDVTGELYVASRQGGTSGRIYRLTGVVIPPLQTPMWLPILRR